jgi:hypothetical protein
MVRILTKQASTGTFQFLLHMIYKCFICDLAYSIGNDVHAPQKLHKEDLHNLYASTNITGVSKSGEMRWTGRVARMGETRNAYNILVRKPKGKRPLRRPRHRRGDNIRTNLSEIVWEGVD